MSEKVKLTREQAEAIKSIRGDINGGFTPGNIRTQLKKQWMSKPYATLNELPFEQFIVAVLGDYEVEETFEVGDLVVREREGIKHEKDLYRKGRLFEIYAIDENLSCPVICKEMGGHVKESLRHATPEEIAEEKQRRWWSKYGREVWELKENDLLYYDDEFKEVEGVSEIGAIMLSSERFYLPLETIKSKYSVACFAEDRKDINGGGIE